MRDPFHYLYYGRDDTIRTCDPLVPNQVLYQAELRPEILLFLQRMKLIIAPTILIVKS
jgi:hypothetical protein